MQDFAEDLRKLFAEADGLDMKPLFQPGVDPQAAAASMASDAGINNLLLQVCMAAGPFPGLPDNLYSFVQTCMRQCLCLSLRVCHTFSAANL